LRPVGFSEDLGDQFLVQRVLSRGPALPLEQLSGGVRRVFGGRTALERYVGVDEATPPSAWRLRARRAAAIGRRLRHETPSPRRFAEDVRLTRWLVSLRR
jgi:hypothetical protein